MSHFPSFQEREGGDRVGARGGEGGAGGEEHGAGVGGVAAERRGQGGRAERQGVQRAGERERDPVNDLDL